MNLASLSLSVSLSLCLSLFLSLCVSLCLSPLHPSRGGGPGPELCGVVPGADHGGPSLPLAVRVPEPSAEGVGDGRPPLPGPMQSPEEEREGRGRPAVSGPVAGEGTCSTYRGRPAQWVVSQVEGVTGGGGNRWRGNRWSSLGTFPLNLLQPSQTLTFEPI